MGQGIITALAQMLAEELEVSYNSIAMVMGDTKLCPYDGGTNGSRSVRYFGPALRAAGAEAREVLLQLAADAAGVESASDASVPATEAQLAAGHLPGKTTPGAALAGA